MRKFIPLLLVGITASVLLTGCSVSNSERDACEASQGTVQSQNFDYKGSGFWRQRTGKVYFCSRGNAMVNVYNDEVLKVASGFFGTNKNNTYIFNECAKISGHTYKTTYTSGKTSYTRYVCIRDGAYVKLLKD